MINFKASVLIGYPDEGTIRKPTVFHTAMKRTIPPLNYVMRICFHVHGTMAGIILWISSSVSVK